ncbi:autotransporter outer membrane beta-barrel domain-containing protein [Endozoicomonas arenosclerae]|uniref:autotransporter family protein n=1 Tax=Endozoicomonas arenosclerae TaxID=1633495 RepID=UPI0007848890|nr:autotransporter outer membrane beta-barrel domain-containing protein [Endozoicomonas arenosclerae]
MQASFNRFLLSTLATAVSIASAQAADWNISAPTTVEIHDTRRIVVGADINSGAASPVIDVKARLGGIKLDTEVILSTSETAGPPSSYEKATIFINTTGHLQGTLENQGHIRNGMVITGQSVHETGNAYMSKGLDAAHQASVQGSYSVVNGGVSEAIKEHAVNIGSDSYMDYILVGSNSRIKSSGTGSSALYVASDGRIGGEFTNGHNSKNLTITRTEADTVINVSGQMLATNGRAIDIVGGAVGKLLVETGGLVQGGGSDAAGVYVSGTYTGTFENKGTIETGVFIRGTQTANQGAAYWAYGTANNWATLTGSYTAVEGGVSQSTSNHAVYLDNYSRADYVVSRGPNSKIEATASEKNAIYVAANAQLGGIGGRGEADAAILVEDGGEIKATSDSAIEVNGTFIGRVHVLNGLITGNNTTVSAVNFSAAKSSLNFLQEGDDAVTTGSIFGSTDYKTDVVEFRAGAFNGATIQNVDHLIVSTQTSSIAMSGNFTLPTMTTVTLQLQTLLDADNQEFTGIDTTNPLITVAGNLDAEADGSKVLIRPATPVEYRTLGSGTTLTVVSANIVEGSVKNRLTVDSGSLLVNAEPIVDSKSVKVKLTVNKAADLKQQLEAKGARSRSAAALAAALDVAVSTAPADATKSALIFAALNDNTRDSVKLANEVQPEVSAGVQRTGQVMANNAHNIIFNRIHGTRRGFNYGDQFVDGAAWGQLLHTSGKQGVVNQEPGFKNQAWGMTLGVDGELEANIRLGLAMTLSTGSIGMDDGAKTSQQSYLTTLYGSWSHRGMFIDAMASMGNGTNDTEKTVNGQTVKGNFQSDQWGFRVVGGTAWRMGSWNLSPQAEFNYGLIRAQDYSEKGSSGFEQKIESDDYITAELGAGFKFHGEIWGRRTVFKPELSVMGYYDFISSGSKVKATYLAGGSSYEVTGPDRDPYRLSAGLAFGVKTGNHWTLRAGYDLNWSENYSSDSFSARVRYEF